MESPSRFSYGPPWRLILFCFGLGIGLLVLGSVHVISTELPLPYTPLPLAVARIGGLLRIKLPRYIETGEDALSVCSGFFQARITRIPYTGIEDTWEVARPGWSVLYVRTHDRKFEINSRLLPDMASYVAVRDFVRSHVTPREKPQAKLAERGKYAFRCSYEGDGEIHASTGKILYRVRTEHLNGQPRYPHRFFRLPDFVVADTAGEELFMVKRRRNWRLAEFIMVEIGSPVCTIKQRSILLNRYRLAFTDGQQWTFHMPLFTVMFKGASKGGDAVRVRLWSHNVWYVAIDSEADDLRLIAALAFIHRERLRCN